METQARLYTMNDLKALTAHSSTRELIVGTKAWPRRIPLFGGIQELSGFDFLPRGLYESSPFLR